MSEYKKQLDELMTLVAKEKASDLHLSVGRHPSLRISGELMVLVKQPVLTAKDTEGMAFSIITPEEKEKFLKEKSLDLSYGYEDKARFRVNIFFQRGFVGAAFRLIPVEIQSLAELNLPPILAEFARKEQGFFLVVGPTGHGKSTTLASLIEIINHERAEHVVTIEDPMEYLFTQDKSIIDQREIGRDTADFASAIRAMFREDVNVAMIGEMRDAETMSAAVTAAETGHLIFSSLHTNSASQTIDRILDSFAAEQQSQIRTQLASALLGVFSQRLVPRISGGRIPAYELLIANTPVRNLIRENKIHEIDLYIETSSEVGMVGLNRSLIDLVRRGEITMETARAYSLNAKSLEHLVG
ncbi:MAG: PilT/PilU family type 4a pilus ATPase [Patescibacteria group bacterium]